MLLPDLPLVVIAAYFAWRMVKLFANNSLGSVDTSDIVALMTKVANVVIEFLQVDQLGAGQPAYMPATNGSQQAHRAKWPQPGPLMIRTTNFSGASLSTQLVPGGH